MRAGEFICEVTLVPTVNKNKQQHLDVMPNDGRPIPAGKESEYLGKLVGKLSSGHQVWTWANSGTRTFNVFDPKTRVSQLATTGTRYKGNRDSFIVKGVYSGPKNSVRAADLYAFLIRSGLTLVSDIKQSAGGYRVWQDLERRYGSQFNIHAFDTQTNQPVNAGTRDEPETHVDADDIGPDNKNIAKNIRFVASAR
jgi:hypothetical protein